MNETSSLARVALLAVALSAALTACGGGGGGAASPAPTPAPAPAPAPETGNGGNGNGNTNGTWSDLGNTQAPAHAAATPVNTGSPSPGGTLTFTNIGAKGYWGRRVETPAGDASCTVQSEVIKYPWGTESCCRVPHEVTNDKLSPFNEELALVLDGPLRLKQLVVYQPLAANDGDWAIRSFWDRRMPEKTYNFHFSGPNKTTVLPAELGNSCTVYAMQQKPFKCGPGSDPYCPGSDLDFTGWKGSKLVVMLASMPYADDPSMKPLSCVTGGKDERAEDSPWLGIAPSELFRDGWSGYSPCHCFSNSNNAGLGDGCGQINLLEVVAESQGRQYGNRDIVSTGIRSFQVGSLGGSTCGIQGCGIENFAGNADLLDANSRTVMTQAAVIDANNRAGAAGPVWRRATDDRYYLVLLDEQSRAVQVAVIHPGSIPAAARTIVPALPNTLTRSAVDGLMALRLPK